MRNYYLECKRKGVTLGIHHFAKGSKPGENVFNSVLSKTVELYKAELPGSWCILRYTMDSPGRAPSIYDIKRHIEQGDHFFDRDTMRFFGQTLRDFRTSWAIKPCEEYPRGVVYLCAKSWGGTAERFAVPHFGGYGKYTPSRLYSSLDEAKNAYAKDRA